MKNKILTVILSISLAFTIALASLNAFAVSNLSVGDVNADGVITLDDVTHLAQYVAGWDVELGVSNNNSSSTENTSTVFSNDIYSSLPNKNEVHVLMWRNYSPLEQQVINQYTALTGVNIKTTVTTEAEYETKLVSLMVNQTPPDVVMFNSTSFLKVATKALKPLDSVIFKLDDPCWNKTSMDTMKINGSYYGVAMPSSINCDDTCYVTYYNPSVLRECGITAMPYQLYVQGKWNWDAQSEIIGKVQNSGRGYTGLSIQNTSTFMHSAGEDFVSYNGREFASKITSVQENSTLVKAWQEMARINATSSWTYWDTSLFNQGKVGLFTAISYGLRSDSGWFTNASNLQAVPVAGPKDQTAYTPTRNKLWGTAKHAPNPEGAAYFLRYFLDTTNYSQNSVFYNNQFSSVFDLISSKTAKKSVMYSQCVMDYIRADSYSEFCALITDAYPENVCTVINNHDYLVSYPLGTSISSANRALQ